MHRLLHFFTFIKRNLLLLVGDYQLTASVLHWGRPDALWQMRKCRDFAQQWAAHPSIMKWSWLYPWFTLAPVPLCFPLPLFNRFTHLFTWHAFPPVTSSTAQLASRVGCLIKTTATGHWFYTLGDAGSFLLIFKLPRGWNNNKPIFTHRQNHLYCPSPCQGCKQRRKYCLAVKRVQRKGPCALQLSFLPPPLLTFSLPFIIFFPAFISSMDLIVNVLWNWKPKSPFHPESRTCVSSVTFN